MDRLARGWGLLLSVALGACSPAKGEPVGVSNGGAHAVDGTIADASVAPIVIAPSFRAQWKPVAKGIVSEHGRMRADVYTTGDRWAEDLFAGDAGVGVYFLDARDGGLDFGIADRDGHAIDASLDACTRCHAGTVLPVSP